MATIGQVKDYMAANNVDYATAYGRLAQQETPAYGASGTGVVSESGKVVEQPTINAPASQPSSQQPMYIPNFISMRTPQGTIASVDVNSDTYKQNIGGQFTGYTPATIEAPAATTQAASALATQNKATETYAQQNQTNLQKVTATPTTTKVEDVTKKDVQPFAEEEVFSSTTLTGDALKNMTEAFKRVQAGTASDIDKTNVARALQRGEIRSIQPISDPVVLQRSGTYIGATQYAKLKSTYTPFQLNSATYKDANGDIFFKPGYSEQNINSIPRTDIKETEEKILDQITDAVDKGLNNGEKEKEEYTNITKEDTKTTTEKVKTATVETTEISDALSEVNKYKKKLAELDSQIDDLYRDIKDESKGEANDSYITALASVRGADILKQKKLIQVDYENAVNSYNSLVSQKEQQTGYDIQLLGAGYTKLASTAGLTSDQYITINGVNYKKPAEEKNTQVVTTDSGIYLVNKDTGEISTLETMGDGKTDLTKYTADDIKNANFALSFKTASDNLDKLGDNYTPTKEEQKAISQFIDKTYQAGAPIVGGGWAATKRVDLYNNLSENAKLYLQASLEGVQAKLRKESGAAITKDELITYMAAYMPSYGDTAGVAAQKKNSRKQILTSFIAGSRGAYDSLYGSSSSATSSSDSIDWNW